MSRKKFQPSDLAQAFAWLMQKISYTLLPMPLLFWQARMRGRWHAWTSPERAEIERNIVSVLGDFKSAHEVKLVARRFFEHEERQALSRIWHKLHGFAGLDRCKIEGLSYLDEALRAGKGVILLTAHFGYSRLLKYALRLKNYKVWLVGPKVSSNRRKQMSSWGKKVYYDWLNMPEFSAAEENDFEAGLNVRPLAQALARNEILVLTADGLRASNLMPVQLLGQTSAFATGSVSLARGTSATILPAFVVDADTDLIGMKICLEPALALEHTDNPKEDYRVSLERFAKIFESYMRRYPHFLQWSRRDLFAKRRKALRADVSDRYHGNFKAR